jgi:hypothetical protein
MRPTLYLLLLFFLFGCKKEEPTFQDRLAGKWELRTTFGGWTGTTSYPNGNGNRLEFTKKTFSRYENGQLSESGTYDVIRDTAWYGPVGDRIIYNGRREGMITFFTLEGDKLSFSQKAMDGGGSEYQRIP